MKRLFHVLSLMCLSISLGACAWAGQKTGKAVNAVEKGAAEFEQGYQQERAPKPSQQSPEQQTAE
ncbi:MAG: hypothetical protein ACLFNA_08600 [Halochromatium sp.]|uniref:hypothetical protein n=1 Tax=Halochromatium sp. TaxID=2049430 RepID=UPI003979BF22